MANEACAFYKRLVSLLSNGVRSFVSALELG